MGTPEEPAAGPPRWSLARRVSFRFACAYLLLYNLPFPLDAVPIPTQAVQSATDVASMAFSPALSAPETPSRISQRRASTRYLSAAASSISRSATAAAMAPSIAIAATQRSRSTTAASPGGPGAGLRRRNTHRW